MKSLIFNFLANYYIDIIVVIVIIVAFFIKYKGDYKKFLIDRAKTLVALAEKEFGSGSGSYKFSLVVTELYQKLPISIRFLFPQKQIEEMIEDAVKELREYLNAGGNLLGYDAEKVSNLPPESSMILEKVTE